VEILTISYSVGSVWVYSERPRVFCVVRVEAKQAIGGMLTQYTLRPLAILEGHTSDTVRLNQPFKVSEQADGSYGTWHLRSFDEWMVACPAVSAESERLRRNAHAKRRHSTGHARRNLQQPVPGGQLLPLRLGRAGSGDAQEDAWTKEALKAGWVPPKGWKP
jgi:hypothetical protein